jgi:hypothetical protein
MSRDTPFTNPTMLTPQTLPNKTTRTEMPGIKLPPNNQLLHNLLLLRNPRRPRQESRIRDHGLGKAVHGRRKHDPEDDV